MKLVFSIMSIGKQKSRMQDVPQGYSHLLRKHCLNTVIQVIQDDIFNSFNAKCSFSKDIVGVYIGFMAISDSLVNTNIIMAVCIAT